MKKKIISTLFAVVMVITMISAVTFAQTDNATDWLQKAPNSEYNYVECPRLYRQNKKGPW